MPDILCEFWGLDIRPSSLHSWAITQSINSIFFIILQIIFFKKKSPGTVIRTEKYDMEMEMQGQITKSE